MADNLQQNKNQYIISTHGVVDIIIRITKTHKEVGVVSADDHSRADHKKHEGNKEITIQTLRNNVINSEINTIRTIFDLVRLKTKFVHNVPNEAILQKFADPQTFII